MKSSATIHNKKDFNLVFVKTNEESRKIEIPLKSTGFGSSVSGGELLLLSLATCFCNDIYRESKKMNLKISEVEVTVSAYFVAEGEPGSDFQYSVNVISNEPSADIERLILHTDQMAEIHKTLRQGVSITLVR